MVIAGLVSMLAVVGMLLAPVIGVFAAAVFLLGFCAAAFGLARHAFMTTRVPIDFRARALSLLGGSAAAFYFGTICQQLAGASGAVFGLMGALLIVFKRQKRDISTILVIVGINLVSNLFTNASLLGHLGGFVIGGLLTLAMVKAPQKNRNAYQIGAVVAAALLLGVMFVLRASELDTTAEIVLEYARTCR